MTPWYADDAVTVWHGDCLDVLADMADNTVDAVVTDPPYLLSFMGRQWDSLPAHRHLAWHGAWAAECHRILKPGGHLLAFGGTRTHHRLAVAIEDAGFEIREGHIWLYAQGFPKSLDVGKAIDKRQCILAGTHVASREHVCPPSSEAESWRGWGTATKPSFEPIVRARKPLVGTVAANVLTWGTGALNIDATRVDASDGVRIQGAQQRLGATNFGGEREGGKIYDVGRWPPNVALDPHTAAALDQESGTLTSGVLAAHHQRAPKEAGILGAYGAVEGERGYGDSGGASRFFPVFRYEPKAPTLERPRADGTPDASAIGRRRCARCGKQAVNVRPSSQCQCDEPEWVLAESSQATSHPTVKPLDLMRWLVRLVTPPGGLVLDPFLGSGTTAEACIVEGFRCVGVEREPCGKCAGGCPDYLGMIRARLTKPIQPVLDLGEL